MTARALEWREAARADLLAIVDYISDDNPDAAQRLKDELEDKASKLPPPVRSSTGWDVSPALAKWSFGPTTSSFMLKMTALW